MLTTRWSCSKGGLPGRSLGCTLRPVELRKPQPALAAFFLKPSSANLDPPLERRLSSHISANLSVATRWWPSVKLTRCRRLATETLWTICARSTCSDVSRDRTLRPIEVLYEAVLGATAHGRVRATKCEIARSMPDPSAPKPLDCHKIARSRWVKVWRAEMAMKFGVRRLRTVGAEA